MKEYQSHLRYIVFAALCLDAIFLLIALIFFRVDGKILAGLLLGSIYAALNQFTLTWTVERLISKTVSRGKFLYYGSFLLRYGVMIGCLCVGFAFLNPFAVVVPMLAPKAAYYFLAITGKNIE